MVPMHSTAVDALLHVIFIPYTVVACKLMPGFCSC